MSEEIDLDQLVAEAESAAAMADRVVRTLDERRRAVVEVVEAATPNRRVRTPAERREAVRRVLQEREAEIQRRRAEREAPPAPEPEPPAATPLPFTLPEHPPEVEAVVEAAMRERKPRTDAQRLEDARRAAVEELERRRAEAAERHHARPQ